MSNKKFPQLTMIIFGLSFLGVIGFIAFTNIQSDSTQETSQPIVKQLDSQSINQQTEITSSSPTAIYTIEYQVNWSRETHPQTLPNGAHVSPIVIVSHAKNNDLFATGSLASDGIEMMAETGATKTLTKEIEAEDSVFKIVIGKVINAPGSNQLEIELNQKHSRLSAVSMLAPSPDWFIGVNSLELFKDGNWLEEIKLNLNPYDAGTDSGITFEAIDINSDPAQAIGPPVDKAFIEAASENNFAIIRIIKK